MYAIITAYVIAVLSALGYAGYEIAGEYMSGEIGLTGVIVLSLLSLLVVGVLGAMSAPIMTTAAIVIESLWWLSRKVACSAVNIIRRRTRT